jgi:RND family efflux transporter MFP subunit
LRGTRAISEEEYDSRSKAVREAEAALAAARATEAVAQLNLDYTRIIAPINGRIGRRVVTVGNLVQGGGMVPGTVMATMVSMDPVYCYFDADEASFLRYRANSATARNAPLACELALVNEEGFPNKGRVDFFDNQVNSKTGTIRMRGTFANPDRALVPGMFAKVRVPAGPPVQALLVPAVAIASDQGNKFVMIVNKDSVVEPRPIEVGRQHGAMWAVTKGLTTQDRVVINGQMMARPGAKVEVVAAPSNGAAPAPTAQR